MTDMDSIYATPVGFVCWGASNRGLHPCLCSAVIIWLTSHHCPIITKLNLTMLVQTASGNHSPPVGFR